MGYEIVREPANKNYHVFWEAHNEKLGIEAVESLGFPNDNSSKTAVNSMILALGKEFATNGPEILGMTADFTTTDLNGNKPGSHTAVDGSQIVTNFALSNENYNGKILNEKGIIPWY
ncbi:hypothetical protein [Paenibacillus sp. FSL H8-0034]|uniref:hypothetical protein n=1 Tax=Paenibacillus sp. FSL H8-0034 TaxID=2954671 RepID=UPI0030FB0C39